MLSELRVVDLGIIAELTVPIGSGMTAITGETGAGKTLLVEALQLLLGGRADATLVREGASEARVDGRFVTADHDEVVLSRVVPREGRSRAYVDGRPATATELAELGARLVDLHGQHEQQSLLVPAAQRNLLDTWCGAPASDARRELATLRARRAALLAELAAYGGDDRARAREIDLLRFQLEEIDAAEIADPDEEARLAAEDLLLGDAENHREALETARDALGGDAADALAAAAGALVGREPFAHLSDRILSAQAELADLALELRVEREGVVADPERLAWVRERRLRLRELRRKYGDTLADVVAFRLEVAARLADLESHDDRAGAIAAERAKLATRQREVASTLTALRRSGAGPLAAEVTVRLRELALADATFSIRVEPLLSGGSGGSDESGESGGGAGITDDGADAVVFELAPNPGEPARPLAKAASGGELSRTMLAIRVVLSDAPPTLVFDEVDAGIGGEAGIAIGAALAGLGERHQVLCVTHLAQVAAHAHAQLHVRKQTTGKRTVAAVEVLLDDARVGALSRMLGGVDDSAHARSHALELLEGARAGRATASRR